jgi:iron(III) transport system permease protein
MKPTLAKFTIPAVLYAILGVLVVIPIVMIVVASFLNVPPFSGSGAPAFTSANYAQLWNSEIGMAAFNTFSIAIGGSAIALVIGCGLAWLAARTDIAAPSFVYLAGIMPLFVSVLVAAAAWSSLASGHSGYINLLLAGLHIPWQVEVESRTGIAFVFGLYYAPYPFLFMYGALTLIHSDLEEAAALGRASIATTLRKITFPLVKPALLGAVLLVFALMAEDFPVPELLGQPVGIQTLSVAIYNLMTHTPTQQNAASALSVVLMLVTAMFVYLQRRLLGGNDYRTVTGKGMQTRRFRLGRARGVAFAAVVVYVLLAMVAPGFALLEGTFRTDLYISNFAALFSPAGLSVGPIVSALTDPVVLSGALNSFGSSLGAALVGTALFFSVAYVVHRTTLPGRAPLDYLATVPVAIPALVLGIGILWTWLASPLPVYGTLTLLSIGYIVRFFPQGYRAVASSMMQVHDDLEHAAQIGGANRRQILWHIMLPLIRDGVASSVFIVFILSLRELTASLFLYTTSTRTLAIVIYEKYISGSWSQVASISVIFTIALALVTLSGRRWLQSKI